MHSFLKQSTASQSRSIGPFLDDTDFKTAETGLTIANTDIKLMINGAASADKNSGGGTHRANGVYGLTFDATDTATVGEIFVSVKVAGALPVFATFVVLEEAVYDALFAASAPGYVANAPVNVAQISGDSTAADNLESYTDGTTPMPVNVTQISGDATAADNEEAFFDGTGYAGTNNVIPTVTTLTNLPAITANWLTATGIANDAITAAKIANGAIDAATFAADVDAEILSYIVDDATRIDASALNTASGTTIPAIVADTNELQTDWADGGRLDLILDARASQASVDTIDGIVDAILVDTAEIGAAGAGLTAVPWNAAWDAEVQSEVDDALVARNLDKLILVSGTADSGSTTTMVDAARTEADADYWKGRMILFTSGNIAGQCAIITDFVPGTDTFTFAPALTQAVATQNYVILPGISVWDDVLADHLGSGSTGAALNAAGSAGDPWNTALPGAYGAGTAGKIVGDNLNATVSSRASQTSVDTVDGIVDAILVDTAEIGVAGAGLTNINLPNQTMDITGNITGNLSGSVGSVTGAVGSVTGLTASDVGAIKAKTDNLPSDPADASDIATATTAISAAVAALRVKKNAALSGFTFKMVDTDDVPATGLTVTATRSLDGAAFGACANAVSEISAGRYKIDLAAGDMNGNVVHLKFTAIGAKDRGITIVTQP